MAEFKCGQCVEHTTPAHTIASEEFAKLFGPGAGIAFSGVGSPDGGVVLQVP